ncbi:MAG: bifunctional chorismate synthase/riboflavin reductase [NAD(P)H] aro2 [Chrysothrix sp. TS-e1954]|nr:MAG: bifunctional chorismate synthase/riboflavin reductase [NAD(P)H] aro2 [Chrysothrix sp. TS-e1954]
MSTFGHEFRVTTAGESHCLSVVAIIDNCPPGLKLSESDIQPQLTRRRPGQSSISTPRNEADAVEIQSGTEFGITLGTPIALRIMNLNQRPHDYQGDKMDMYPRPSHADFTYLEKYGVKASSGGGRSSARETICRVAAGAVAEKVLREAFGVEVIAFTESIGHEHLFPASEEYPTPSSDPRFLKMIDEITREKVDSFIPVRCPDTETSKRMEELIGRFRDRKDSIGGTITCVVRNVPTGLGEPCFDKLEAKMAHAMLSIPAVKAFSIGSGFGGCEMPGSRHNDAFVRAPHPDGQQNGNVRRPMLTTKTNHSGGIQGGISNGSHVYFTVGFKPPATIGLAQTTAAYNESNETTDGVLEAKGRHDPCVVPRAIPIVESMASLVLLDALMAQEGRTSLRERLPVTSKSLPVEGAAAAAMAQEEVNGV